MVDLSTSYLGLSLKNPLVVSASPISKKVESIRRFAEAGVGAVVVYSLFEEQIVHESNELDFFLNQGTESYPESLSYFPDLDHYNVGPEGYLDHIRRLKNAVDIPVIGSLNGLTSGGWLDYAARIQEAGADALELNIYSVPTDPAQTSEEIEDNYVELVNSIRKQVSIPLAVKLSAYFTSMPNFTSRLAAAGANGLVLFNRFYQPDLDVETLEVVPDLKLSTSDELRLPLRWVAILYGRVQADLALTGGVHTCQDMVKAIMAGASVTMLASELIAHGSGRASELIADLEDWLETYEYQSVSQMKGSMSQKAVADPAAFERANYMKALSSFDNRLP
ncbi:MAG TPA: dihydroorotate dehydrogenase-like protein [Anaerolineaceae bacterium]|nr:dihydroorotate dehydrogenase-like protein [Anaerolineaceae bacterium]